MRSFVLAVLLVLAGCVSPDDTARLETDPEQRTSDGFSSSMEANWTRANEVLQLVVARNGNGTAHLVRPGGDFASGQGFDVCTDTSCPIGSWSWSGGHVKLAGGEKGVFYVDASPGGQYTFVATAYVNETTVAQETATTIVANMVLMPITGPGRIPFEVAVGAGRGVLTYQLSVEGPAAAAYLRNNQWMASTGIEIENVTTWS